MEDGANVKKKSKTAGPLKSSPGFLKCMRSVYLYFKEEKEKGALNIPINSFIERTAVACGVGRKTLYNYAKKGLFDEHPIILQPKKKKRMKLKRLSGPTSNGSDDLRRGRLSRSDEEEQLQPKKKPSRSVLIQTETPYYITTNDSSGLSSLTCSLDKNKRSELEVQGPWASGTSTRRDIDYFTKTNIWQSVYTINASDPSSCTTELAPARMGNCQPTTSAMTDL